MASAEIITVGTELLLGQLVDTNTTFIAKTLADAGIDVHRETSVGDNTERIAAAIAEALGRADAVVVAGGLGPTVDDLTREAAARATGRSQELHEPSLARIRTMFDRLGRPMADNNRRQAMMPAGAFVLDNELGTAPGFIIEEGTRAVIAVPGVPREMRAMISGQVVPWLVKRFDVTATIVTRVLNTIGLGESDLDQRIADLFHAGVNPSIAVLAHFGQVDVKLTAKAHSHDEAVAMLDELEPRIRERLPDCIYAIDGGPIEQVVGELLRIRGWTLATAESCTGGRIASMLTRVAGASDYYLGGVVSYANEAKLDFLDVAPELIERYGAVSEEVATAMAVGAQAHLRASCAIAVTGIAGPGGGSEEKPVGLVYVALAGPDATAQVRKLMLPGDREMIQRRAAMAALTMLWKAVR
ncbi:MAG: competence/damage-inducible protein A [Candidatus Eremiobacteraeota bacterium]|nr:competence/damage-inducible protein A [Candidatus Eremiobacteraeota bacterium]